MVAAHNLNDILAGRGIAEPCNAAGWVSHPYKGFDGWRYPIYNAAGQHYTTDSGVVWRWKNAEQQPVETHPRRADWRKYAWLPSKPEKAKYYLLPDTLQAIKDKRGVVYLASGEPDVMAYRAAGIRNVISWFDGEKSIPDTLLDDLHLMGATVVNVYPDRDKTGMEAAAALWALFKDQERMRLFTYALPGVVGSKHDINWLWQQHGFNSIAFTEALYDAPPVDSDTLLLYAQDDAPRQHVSAVGDTRFDGFPQGFVDAMIRHVESRDGFKHWTSDGWGNFCCDLPNHQDSAASAGFNKETMAFKCFVCGTMNARDYGAAVDIHLRDYYPTRDVEPLNIVTLSAVPGHETSSPKPQPSDDTPLWDDSSDAGLEVIAELRGEKIPDVRPVEFPLKALHRFGGFAKMAWPGKLIYVTGVSGGGKTSFGETISEVFQQDGQDSIWYNPEWTGREMRIRALQRAGGINMTRYAEMLVNNIDAQDGKTLRRGLALDRGEIDANVKLMQGILNWPGSVYTLKSDKRLSTMKAILETAEQIVNLKRAAGRTVTSFFFDYIQRAPKADVRGWDSQEWVVSQIKEFCERCGLLGWVFLQPTKGASKSTRDGAALTEASGQGLSDQQANLYITMTPAFSGDGDKYPYTRLNIVKNSMGQSGKIYLKWSYQHLAVVDEEISEDYLSQMGWVGKEAGGDD